MSFLRRKDTLNIQDGKYKFNPTEIPNLVAHFDISDLSTVTHDVDGKVSEITETKFGGARRLIQNINSDKPTLILDGLNQKPALRFTGSEFLELSPFVTLNGAFSTFVVLNNTTPDENNFYFGNSIGVGMDGLTSAVNPRSFYTRGEDSGSLSTTDVFWYFNTKPTLSVVTRYIDNTLTAQIDNKSQRLLSFGGSIFEPGTRTLRYVGGAGDSNHWKGNISEILIYNQNLDNMTSNDRRRIIDHLIRKWSL